MDKHKKLLILIFILILTFRLYFAFQTPNYNYEAYSNFRQINEITETGTPFFNDPLSFGGRTYFFSPAFHYILAFFNLFLPSILVFKILPNIFASTLVFITYLIAEKLTKNKNIALLTSFASAFIPVYLVETVNNISIYSLIIPLMFLMIYFIMDLEKKKIINYAIATIFFLTILHPSSFLLIIGLLLYLFLIRLEHIKQNKAELELILFSTFLIIWVQFLIFKKAFLLYGASVIWQNVPKDIFSLYFAQTNIILAIINIGLVPLICGVFIIYKYAFKEKNKDIYLLMGFALSVALLLWLRLLQPAIGLTLLGIVLTLLFPEFYKVFLRSINKTRLIKYRKHIFALFILIFILTSVIPSYFFTKAKVESSATNEEIEALGWLKENSNKNATILGTLEQGHLITAIADRKNVIDSNFLLADDLEQRFYSLERIYQTPYKIEAVTLLNKYNVDYILVSNQTASELGIDQIEYINDEDCFILAYNNSVDIYKSVCKIEET